jgi:ferrous iron transport protein B
MQCHGPEQAQILNPAEVRILLMGNPNVGKSVIFSKLTGMDVLAANYIGTTISYTYGNFNLGSRKGVLIDVPGTYSLEDATSPAEETAVNMLKDGASAVICVLDATNLERNLNLALQVQQTGLPVVFAINLTDVASAQGVSIDAETLSQELGAPVIATVATRNKGLRELLELAWKVAHSSAPAPIKPLSRQERWQKAVKIASLVQTQEYRQPTFWERMGELTLRPIPGLPIAALVLLATLGLVVGGGKAIRGALLLPLLNNHYVPFITRLITGLLGEGVIRNILVGDYGVLIKGIEWPFALILPYVILFYITLSILEDTGYMPRLGVLVDGILRKIGIQGGTIVPMIMGYGCAVPAILGTRASTSYKERIMVTTLVSLSVPCVAQTGAFIYLLGERSIIALIGVYLFSLAAMLVTGIVMNRVVKGKVDPMLLEIPNLLKPDPAALGKKIWLRTRHFMMEAEVPMLLGIAFAALVVETGFLDSISAYIAPLVTGWLGLPQEASIGLMLGIIRRELAVLPLLELNLSTFQLFVGALVALFYVPCLSVFAVIIKEFNLKTALLIGVFTLFMAFFIAGMVNQVGQLFMAIL